MTEALLAVAVAVLLGVVLLLLRRRTPAVSPLSALVLEAMEGEWSRRVGADAGLVRTAVLRGEPAELHDRLRALIGGVDIEFTFEGAAPVQVLAQCAYADGNATTAALALPWENAPREVRAEFLRGGENEILRRWTMP